MNWSELRIAVIGGDEREAEIARLAAETGARVSAFGFPLPHDGIGGVEEAGSAAEATRNANYVLLPIPGIAADGSLFAPAAPDPILADAALVGELAPGTCVILGAANDELRVAAEASGVELCEYEDDRTLMLLRAPAIVEGAIAEIVRNTEVTIHAAEVAVVGFGTIGGQLARTLVALGANVHVAARNPEQRAAAEAAGAQALTLSELPALAPRLSILCSAVPAQVVGEGVLNALPAGALVMDLAAPPGSVDLGRAESLGLRAVWARGLGRRAPITVGRSQWGGIRERIERFEAAGIQS